MMLDEVLLLDDEIRMPAVQRVTDLVEPSEAIVAEAARLNVPIRCWGGVDPCFWEYTQDGWVQA